MVSVEINRLTVEEYIYLIQSSGWMSPFYDQVDTAIRLSFATFSVYEDGELVGMGRLLGDGALAYFIKDVIILPDYQRRGLGTFLVRAMLDYISANTRDGWNCMVELMSALHKERFYEQLGFTKRPTYLRGAGMSMIVKGNLKIDK